MKTVNLPEITREQAVNEPAADRLQFPPTRAYPKNRTVIHATYDGFQVQFELCDIGIGRVEEFIVQLTERGLAAAMTMRKTNATGLILLLPSSPHPAKDH